MEELPHQRLKQARIAAGYVSARAFALANGQPENTYRAHEVGNRGISDHMAKIYAPLLGVDWHWILYGTPQELSREEEALLAIFRSLPPEKRVMLREIGDAVSKSVAPAAAAIEANAPKAKSG